MSQKPIAQKLLIKENCTILLVNEPKEYRSLLGNLPPNVTITTKPSKEQFDLVQFFVTSEKDLEQIRKLKANLGPKTVFWVTYPKRSSGVKVYINRDVIREFASTIGLQAVSLVSINETWSALRLKLK